MGSQISPWGHCFLRINYATQNLANEVFDTYIVTGIANTLSLGGIALHHNLERPSLIAG